MKFEGGAELAKALRDLGDSKAIKRAIGKALLLAAEPAAKDARARAPRKTGRMAEDIDVSTTLSRRQRKGRRRSSDPTEQFVYIGASPVGPAVLEEFGTGPRRTKKGASRGSAPAKPFMRPAWEQHREQILRDFARYLWVTIQAEAERLAKKQAALIRKGRSGR